MNNRNMVKLIFVCVANHGLDQEFAWVQFQLNELQYKLRGVILMASVLFILFMLTSYLSN